LTNVGTATHTIDEVVVGTPVPEPVPVPSPGVGGGTYAPIFPQEIPKLVPIKEVITNAASSVVDVNEFTTVDDVLTVVGAKRNNITGWYRKQTFTAYPTLPDIELPPKVSYKLPRFPDELPSGITASQRRQREEEQLILLGLI